MADQIVTEYREKRVTFEEFSRKVETLLRDLLRANKIYAQSVSSRCKDPESLAKKITKKEGKYRSLADITDLVGIRIITYFADDVDRVGKIVRAEFEVDRANSVDKRRLLADDQFGYQSLHYIVRLSQSRRSLAEYAHFSDINAEVQVRSVLQHAWAEIEHDLGYKAVCVPPPYLRRRFHRLAGLLELADEEFRRLRDEIAVYGQRFEARLSGGLAKAPIDEETLSLYVLHSEIARELDDAIARLAGKSVFWEPSQADHSVAPLPEVDPLAMRSATVLAIGNLDQLEELLWEHRALIVEVAQQRFTLGMKNVGSSVILPGVCVTHLGIVCVRQTQGAAGLAQFLATLKFPGEEGADYAAIADRLFPPV